MAQRSTPKRTDTLRLEQRVPEGYSAMPREHEWHDADATPIDVTSTSASEMFEHADVLMQVAADRDRKDYEYRVVLTHVETTGWVVA